MAALNYIMCGFLTVKVLFFISLSQAQADNLPDFSLPVLPADYQRALRQGFDTHYFKSRDKDFNPTPARDYRPKNIQDVYDKGFRNLRLRVTAHRYQPPYEDEYFTNFTIMLNEVVDKCLEVGVAPVITWIHHEAEAYPNDIHRENYINWWTKVATAMRNKNYQLSFNLFTELGKDYCSKNDTPPCGDSLRERLDLYTNWTLSVISAIRATGGNNEKRILFVSSPEKLSRALHLINESIYINDEYLMVEWHDYAAGPYNRPNCINQPQRVRCRRYWVGNGTAIQRNVLKDGLDIAKTFEPTDTKTGLLSYFGEWMPIDHKRGTISQDEAINFSHFFVKELKDAEIPWSLNVLNRFYDTIESRWKTEDQDFNGTPINMSLVLDHIIEEMNN